MKLIFASALIFLTLTLLPGCSDDDNVTSIDLSGKRFVHDFFESEQDCLDAQVPGGLFINCFQELYLVNEQEALVLLTDINNKAEYSVFGGNVIVHPSAATEFANELVFKIINKDSLRWTANDSI